MLAWSRPLQLLMNIHGSVFSSRLPKTKPITIKLYNKLNLNLILTLTRVRTYTHTYMSCSCVLVYLNEGAHSIPGCQDRITVSVFTSNCTSPAGAGSVCVHAPDIKSSFGLHTCTHWSMNTPTVWRLQQHFNQCNK